MKWKTVGVLATVLGVILLSATFAMALSAYWTGPTQYTDGSAISTADQARITYTVYSGSTASGPWTVVTTTAAGATSAVVPAPSSGVTLWYTGEANLDGQTSAKATPASYTTPFKSPAAPSGFQVR